MEVCEPSCAAAVSMPPAHCVISTHAGDFWHVRGALPVETLNSAVLRLSQWTQPTIMLVGNHDQVCLLVDALEGGGTLGSQ